MIITFPEGEVVVDDPDKYTLLKTLRTNEELKEVQLSKFYSEFKQINENKQFTDFKDLETVENNHNALCYFGAEDQLKEFYKNVYLHEKQQIQNHIFEFFQKHPNKDWEGFSSNLSTTIESDDRYWETASWDYLSKRLYDAPGFYMKFLSAADWLDLSRNPNIPIEFWEKHLNRAYWYHLSINPGIPLEFFKKHLDKVVWHCLSGNSSIPIEFLEEHIDKVDWNWLSRNDFKFYIINTMKNLKKYSFDLEWKRHI